MRSSIIGLFLGVMIVYYAVINIGENSAVYLNMLSIIIVFGGSFSVAIITYGLKNTFKLISIYFKAFSTAKYTSSKAVEVLVKTSNDLYFSKKSIQEIRDGDLHPFVSDGLRLIHNKIEENKLKKILFTMLQKRHEHHESTVEKLHTLAKYPPAFGMMGTVIGLVDVLNKINSAENIAQIGPSMALALITTLYGIFLSNYIIQPIADNLHARGQEDIRIREIIAEGLLLLAKNENPVYVREILMGHLMPIERDSITAQLQDKEHIQKVAA